MYTTSFLKSNPQANMLKELQYRSVLLHAEEGQQVGADGLLPGTTPINLGSTRPYTVLGRYWNVYHSRNCNSLHGQGFKDVGYDARQSFGCSYYE